MQFRYKVKIKEESNYVRYVIMPFTTGRGRAEIMYICLREFSKFSFLNICKLIL